MTPHRMENAHRVENAKTKPDAVVAQRALPFVMMAKG